MVTLKYITPNAEQFISEMAAVCYDADINNTKRLAKLMKLKHLSTLRFASAVFQVTCSRVCSHQLVRHKHLDYLQESQRYVEFNSLEDNTGFFQPAAMYNDTYAATSFQHSVCNSIDNYKNLLKMYKCKKEDARYTLPGAVMTKLNIVGNLQAWYDFIKLRNTKAAQWEIRDIAKQVYNQLHAEVPNVINEDMFKKECNCNAA